MQYFHWYLPADGNLWSKVETHATELAESGFTALWLPPAYKASGRGYDVGYGTFEWGWAEFHCRGGSVSVWVQD
jgi:alpha-amylase